MRIAIVTDAWSPQVNGVVTTLQRTAAALETLGHRFASRRRAGMSRFRARHGHARARDARGYGVRHTCRRLSRHGAIDVVAPGVTGVLDEDLSKAALALDRDGCRRVASTWTWERASVQFLDHLVRARDGHDFAAPVAATAAS